MSTLSSHTSKVKNYYETNTRRFLRTGKDAGSRHIHQPLWLNKHDPLEVAIHASINMVLEELETLKLKEANVLDLGCGVGSSLFYLANHYTKTAQFKGITISPTQVQIAQQYIEKHGYSNVSIQEGNFQNLPNDLGKFDLIYAIEAFAHSPAASIFFQQVANHLSPNGKLILIDDTLAKDSASLSTKEKGYLKKFKSGWMMGSIHSMESIQQFAEAAGLSLQNALNLSPHMRIGRPRDQFIGLLSWLLGPFMEQSVYLNSLKGGFFKQKCLKEGIVKYRKMVFANP